MPQVTELTIERSKWYRGQNGNESRLRRRDGQMCCLGFFGLACGYTEADITFEAEPSTMFENPDMTNFWPSWLYFDDEQDGYDDKGHDTDDCDALMKTNDDQNIDDAEREKIIAETFAKHGVTVTFVD